jgi:proline dehydrogenase
MSQHLPIFLCENVSSGKWPENDGLFQEDHNMPVLRSFFIALSHNKSLRHFCENTRLGVRLSSRFVAGMEIEDALRAAEALNKEGMAVTLDSLGESVTSEEAAGAAADVYHKLLDAIAEHKLNANISLKLTQMGLGLSPALAKSIAENVAQHAKATGSFLRIDMEDSPLTSVTIEIVERLHAQAGIARSARNRDPGLPLPLSERH